MKCPKCGFLQEKAEACARCGIIFQKYFQAQAREEDAGVSGGPEMPGAYADAVGAYAAAPYRRQNLEKRLTILVILSLAAALGGYIFFKGAGSWLDGRATRSWLPAEGVVTGSLLRREPTGNRGFKYSPHVAYSYEAGGLSHEGKRVRMGGVTGQDASQAVVDSFPRGAKIRVYYDPDNPGESVLFQGITGWLLFKTLAWGLVFLISLLGLVFRGTLFIMFGLYAP